MVLWIYLTYPSDKEPKESIWKSVGLSKKFGR